MNTDRPALRRNVVVALSTVSAVVLLFSYRTSTGGSAETVAAPAVTAVAEAAPAPTEAPAAQTVTFTGSAVSTRWGPVQVEITVVGGRITAAPAIVAPDGNRRDQEINAAALPILESAAVTAQSAEIDSVSGATVTSDGYTASLQSAIDQAHL